jgi:hypothetical protein
VEVFDVEDVSTHQAVEPLDDPVLVWPAFLDVGALDALRVLPAGEVAGDELAAVVAAQRLWLAPALVEGVCQGALHAPRPDRPLDRGADQLAGVLVDDVEDPKRAAVGGVAADEVIRPDMVGMLGSAFPHRVLGAALGVLARPLLFRLFEPFSPPQAFDPLVVDPPPLIPQPPADRLVALLGMIVCQLVQPGHQAPLEDSWVRPVAIGRAVLADQAARPPLRHPMPPLQMSDGLAPTRRAHQFPRCRSFNIWMSNAWLATIFFSWAFSASSAFNRAASASVIVPNFSRHR